jgi:hypothetical protein
LFFDLPADVKFISFVKTTDADFVDLTQMIQEKDPLKKADLLKRAVATVASSRILTEVQYVWDNHICTFGDAGYVLHQSANAPVSFDWNFMALRSGKKENEIGQMMANVEQDAGLDGFANQLFNVLATASNPAATAFKAIGGFIFETVKNKLLAAGDEQIGILYMSLNRVEHYPHLLRDRQDVRDITGNMQIDYTIFGTEEKPNT